jgi:DHA2 family multidrug resistance protein
MERALVPVPQGRKMICTALIMAATVLVVIDSTIANVVLPHMQAALGATPETITWVLTSYVLASAIGTPITGWLTGRFGRTEFFAIAILGFTVSSMVCGISVSLPMMVISRVVQGFFGAFLVPMSQTFLYDMNPPSKQVRAITIWGVGVNAAPIFGPVLGGYLTEVLNWRWVFFINVPIGVVTAVGIFALLPKFPATRRGFDHLGFVMILVAVCGLQLALDRGASHDWFESTEILVELSLSVAAFWMLFFHLRHSRNPLVPIALFRIPDFNAAVIISCVVLPVVTTASALLPPVLQLLLGYPVETTAIVLIPRAIAVMVGIMIGGRLMKLIDMRIQIIIGVLMIAASLELQTGFTIEMGKDQIIWSGILQGGGLGMSMIVINFVAIASTPANLRTEGAALYTLIRNVCTSIVIAVASALLARNIQLNHLEVGSAIKTGSSAFGLAQLAGGNFTTERLAAMANVEINKQAMMIAYLDDFYVMMWATLATIPLVLLISPKRQQAGETLAVLE